MYIFVNWTITTYIIIKIQTKFKIPCFEGSISEFLEAGTLESFSGRWNQYFFPQSLSLQKEMIWEKLEKESSMQSTPS